MAKKTKDSTSAFPGENSRQSGPNIYYSSGMELRDYFAAKLITVILPGTGMSFNDTVKDIPRLADLAYEMADAMMVARNKGK